MDLVSIFAIAQFGPFLIYVAIAILGGFAARSLRTQTSVDKKIDELGVSQSEIRAELRHQGDVARKTVRRSVGLAIVLACIGIVATVLVTLFVVPMHA